MSMPSHLEELEKKHQAMESEINEYSTRLGADDLVLRELKRRKLMLKDQIERLRHSGQVNLH
jgi:hypothetical protein